MFGLQRDDKWIRRDRRGADEEALLKKTREKAIELAALGLSYSKVGSLFGFAKSTLCKWLKQEELSKESMTGRVAELDGLWTRTSKGQTELKVIRDNEGNVLVSFDDWEKAISGLYEQGLESADHLVSDGDRAIEGAIELVYGSKAPHQLCQFHLLREYRRNIGSLGFKQAKDLLEAQSKGEAYKLASVLNRVTGGKAAYWSDKVLRKGLTFLETGHERFKTTSRLERFQRELRRRESMGTWWTPYNLIVLLQHAGLVNSTT